MLRDDVVQSSGDKTYITATKVLILFYMQLKSVIISLINNKYYFFCKKKE